MPAIATPPTAKPSIAYFIVVGASKSVGGAAADAFISVCRFGAALIRPYSCFSEVWIFAACRVVVASVYYLLLVD